tara:strand:- start:1895 stop:3157 length:1263 start_codon:yes stop_codon:yes gene_type:complete
MSKWNYLDDKIINLFREDETLSYSKAARTLLDNPSNEEVDKLRTYIRRFILKGQDDNPTESVISETKANDYVSSVPFKLSAWSSDGTIMDIDEYCSHHKLPRNNISSYKLITHTSSPYYNCVFKEVVEGVDTDLAREELIAELKTYSPDFKTYVRTTPKEGHLLIVNPSDVHINKLALESETRDGYDIDIAVQRITEGVEGILTKASGFDIDKILFVIGNDILHTDNAHKTTTNGTPQDTVTSWSEAFKVARRVYVNVLERLVSVADVHVVHTPSNHDMMSGYMLADSLYSWFNKSDNITWDIGNEHRKYWAYGNSLIGITHGDGCKMDNLPLVMANEDKKGWANSEFRYFLLGHLHHFKGIKFQDGKDYHGVTVEYMRSPSGADYWHHKSGFQHAKKAIEGFIHSKDNGRVAKIIHSFK